MVCQVVYQRQLGRIQASSQEQGANSPLVIACGMSSACPQPVCPQNGRQMLLLGLLDTAKFQLGHAAVALASLVAHSCESKARLLQASYFTYWEVVPLPSSGLRDSKRLETPVASTRLQRLASTLRCSRKQPSLPAWASRSLAQGLLRRRACPSSQGRP